MLLMIKNFTSFVCKHLSHAALGVLRGFGRNQNPYETIPEIHAIVHNSHLAVYD